MQAPGVNVYVVPTYLPPKMRTRRKLHLKSTVPGDRKTLCGQVDHVRLPTNDAERALEVCLTCRGVADARKKDLYTGPRPPA